MGRNDLPPVKHRGMIIRMEDDARASPQGGRTNTEKDFLETGSAGASTILQPGGQTAAWKSFISINTEDRKSIPLTVTLSNYISGNSAIAIGSPRGSLDAKISWGAGGGSAEAIIDFMNGCIFTIVCSSLGLDIRNTYPNPGFNQNVFTMSAFLSKGPKGSGFSPQRTIQIIGEISGSSSMSPGESSVIAGVPQFAKTVVFARGWSEATHNIPAIEVNINDGNGNAIESIIVGNNQPCPRIVLPNGAISFQIKNRGATSIGTPQAVFDLAI